MNSSQKSAEKLRSTQVPQIAVVLMIIIIVSLTLVAVFANIQHFRRHQIETIVITPASSTTPVPR
ncbi:MAG TPA: hypothetical protein VFQ83_08120 [Candidatus Udaeobacter sp.]|jgi:hypothetical protein|nr:hypothetical protein [Candidatus Udaeobacter sp.]